MTISNVLNIFYINQESSEGGYDPETAEEIRKEKQSYTCTINTLVILNGFKILARDFDGVADVSALDYNYPESGLIQPTDDQVNDQYKVNPYILPLIEDNLYKTMESEDTDNILD